MGLAWFVLGCGFKQITTEVHKGGGGRNIFIYVIPKAEDQEPEDEAQQEQDLQDAMRRIETCGAKTSPYSDDHYQGFQAILDFDAFDEIPGQISCLMEKLFDDPEATADLATLLQIEGRYEKRTRKENYRLQIRIKPFALWLLSDSDPMLYRVVMPGQIVAYTNLQTDKVRTVKDAENQISWYFTYQEEFDSEEYDSNLEYTLTVQAERAIVPATEWLTLGGILGLTVILITAVGLLIWQVTNVSTRARSTAPAKYPAPGTILDRYQIREELGRGGMAIVYRARHRTLHRDVALKVLDPRLTATPDFVRRFRREGRILAQLAHPHIVIVHDAGSAQGYYYLVMELVRGYSLDRALRRWGRLEPRHAVAIARQVAKALDYAHRQGIIHRDIKPANILLDERGRAKVADFGIVAIVGESQAARTRIGTPRYMAYEQFNGAAVPQSDLYSLGACLYEMLTGQCPPAFGLQTPVPPSRFNQAVSPALDHAVLKCLRPDPRRRYATAAELRAALKRCV